MIDKPSVENAIVKEIKKDEIDSKKIAFALEVVGNTIQLSHDPITKWSTLSNLELIKERNKPIEAPKQPEQAPFFLSTIPGITPRFTTETPITNETETENENSTTNEEEERSRFVKRGNVFKVENDLQKLLREAYQHEKQNT